MDTLRTVPCYATNIHGPVLIEDVFTNICNVLSLYTDTYLYTNTTLYRYDYKHANVFESIKNFNKEYQ